MDADSFKELAEWAKNQGATKLTVGEYSVEFAPAIVSESFSKSEYEKLSP